MNSVWEVGWLCHSVTAPRSIEKVYDKRTRWSLFPCKWHRILWWWTSDDAAHIWIAVWCGYCRSWNWPICSLSKYKRLFIKHWSVNIRIIVDYRCTPVMVKLLHRGQWTDQELLKPAIHINWTGSEWNLKITLNITLNISCWKKNQYQIIIIFPLLIPHHFTTWLYKIWCQHVYRR